MLYMKVIVVRRLHYYSFDVVKYAQSYLVVFDVINKIVDQAKIDINTNR